jgi:hypothetical protein
VDNKNLQKTQSIMVQMGNLRNIEMHFESAAVTLDKILMFKGMERFNVKVVM